MLVGVSVAVVVSVSVAVVVGVSVAVVVGVVISHSANVPSTNDPIAAEIVAATSLHFVAELSPARYPPSWHTNLLPLPTVPLEYSMTIPASPASTKLPAHPDVSTISFRFR